MEKRIKRGITKVKREDKIKEKMKEYVCESNAMFEETVRNLDLNTKRECNIETCFNMRKNGEKKYINQNELNEILNGNTNLIFNRVYENKK